MPKMIGKIFIFLIVLELLLFVGMILTSMTDQTPPSISSFFYWTLKYIFGFPLVLVKNEYPFFLDSKHVPAIGWVLILVNNFILSLGIWQILKLFS